MAAKISPAFLAKSEADYARLGLKKEQIEPWEDGMRTHGGKGTYEWWYFDAHLNDGSKLVIVFYTKFYTQINKPLKPLVTINHDRADGKTIERMFHAKAGDFSASTEQCDVKIGRNYFRGNLQKYEIHVEIEDLVADITLTRTAPSWRPATGHLYFGEQGEHLFAWLPSVPQGQAEVSIRVGGQSQQFRGVGYHDHNWGNISMLKLMNNWYWARGAIGDYTVIASYITTEKKYGYKTFPVFMLAKNGKIVADDDSKVHFEISDIYKDAKTRKPVANKVSYTYQAGGQRYVLTFKRERDILRTMLAEMAGKVQAIVARLIGFDGAYLRFVGDLKLARYEGDSLVETQHEEAIWELMYFGRVE
jgi:predicted secreted hydrolase